MSDTDKFDSTGNIVLDGNVLLGNIVCISKARLGDYVADLTSDEMKRIDTAISISLDLNHHYQTIKNSLNDKLQYIEKLQKSVIIKKRFAALYFLTSHILLRPFTTYIANFNFASIS